MVEDSVLWKKIRRGDKNSFDELYNRYSDVLFNYSRKLTISQILVEESIQDLFFKIWIKREKLSKVENVKAYLFLSIRRILLRKVKEEVNSSFSSLDKNQNIFVISDESRMIEEERRNDQNRLVESAFSFLTQRQKEIVFLKFFENLSYAEISDILEIDIKGTYKLMARAIQKLREVLNKKKF
ncbi:MAG: sigma-70 family RNA polymerase sigma factor [Cytophagales bacterium]|nr:sigma-70 family RNA polymerase sigma factor [Cytophagales bacterium]